MMPDDHTRDDSDTRIAKSSMALDELCARVSNIFVRKGLSPPFHLRAVAEHWLGGITPDEIIDVVETHFADHRRGYHTGSGDQLFHVLQGQIRKVIEAKHPSRDRADGEPVRPRRKRGVRKVHNASGFPDVIVDCEDGDPIDEDGENS
jgi:hypothetical protein